MATPFMTLFVTYLIYLLIAILLVGFVFIMGKKNDLLRNKRLITYTLLSVPVLAVPALPGFLDYGFMPYAYITSSR